MRAQGFTRVVSLLASTHNLHAYDELHLEWSRFPIPVASDTREVLSELYPALHGWLRSGERILLHQEELGDCVMGVAAGYLLWSEILPDGPRAITAMEQLLRRQMGTVGRMIVSVVEEVPPSQAHLSGRSGADENPRRANRHRRGGAAAEGRWSEPRLSRRARAVPASRGPSLTCQRPQVRRSLRRRARVIGPADEHGEAGIVADPATWAKCRALCCPDLRARARTGIPA